MTRLWLVRLGRYGESEGHALESGELVTGWTLEDLSAAVTKQDILDALQRAEPQEKSGTLENWANQLNQFKNSISPGDLVVTPLKTTGQVAIGQVEGGYFHADGKHPARRVKWLNTEIPRDVIGQDLIFSLGAAQTICEIKRNNAVARFKALLETGRDPALAGPTPDAGDTAEIAAGADQTIDLASIARDAIERRIATKFSGHAFTQLVAAILRAQGYQTRVSPPGPDRGIDIVAGQGSIGFDGPRLVVQVKSGNVIVDQPTLQSLLGCIEDTKADHALLVSWSGFNAVVRQRTNELYFRVRFWGRDEILEALFSVYEQLPEEIRADLPLKRIWALVPEDEPSA